jgi:hypothetical protein
VHELEDGLYWLSHEQVAEFSLQCAERVAENTIYLGDVADVIEISRRYLKNGCSKKECFDAAWELRDLADMRAANMGAPLYSAWHAARAALEASDAIRQALRAADYACEASTDWATERTWQRERLALTVSPERGKPTTHGRLRPSDLAGRQTLHSFLGRRS